MTTRERIRKFSLAFGRPVNESWTDLTVTERELLGNLLLEEAVEYCVKGLGLSVDIQAHPDDDKKAGDIHFVVNHVEGVMLNPVECVDGLADVNVVTHFNAHWHGFNLDKATEIVNESNMSKLDANGNPIINREVECDECDGRGRLNRDPDDYDRCCKCGGKGRFILDPSKPIGKILKGPNFFEPQARLIAECIIPQGGNAS